MRCLALVIAVAAAGCNLLVAFDPPAESGAQCSDGVDNDGNGLADCEEAACASACLSCGDGDVDDGEQCDDGNATPDDGCEDDCTFSCAAEVAADARAYDPSTGHCYLGFTTPRTTIDAYGACLEIGGYLAVPGDAAEDARVRAAAADNAALGLVDDEPGAGYHFVTAVGQLEATYLNFTPGQPDEPVDQPDICVSYDGAAQTWQDNPCDAPRPYVCELHADDCGDLVVQLGEDCDDGNDEPGDGCDACVDEDECALGTDACSPDADCFNLDWRPEGGYGCMCHPGFSGDGFTCTPNAVFQPRPPTPIQGALATCGTGSSLARKLALTPNGELHAILLCSGDAYAVRSTDAGASWSAPLPVGTGVAEATVVGVDPGRAVAAMLLQTGDIVVRQTLDSGQTWGPTQLVFAGAVPGTSLSAAAAAGTVYVGFSSTGGPYRVHRSIDGTLSSMPGVDTIASIAFGDVLVDPTLPAEIWAVGDTPDFHLRRSTDGAQTFPTPESNPPGAQETSDWAIGGGRIFVTGGRNEVTVIPTANPGTSQTVQGLPTAEFGQRSITADPGGTTVIAQRDIDGVISVVRLPSGATALDTPVQVDAIGASPSATMVPGGLVALVYTAGSEVRVAIVNPATAPPAVGGLIHRWSFENGSPMDRAGHAHGSPSGGPAFVGGRLIVDGVDDHLRTNPIEASIGPRTLVAWVALDNLTQQGGSVVSLEAPSGTDVFDAIVYGEAVAGEWYVGSDVGARSSAATGLVETVTAPALVMMAIAYDADGTITMYRDGSEHVPAYTPGPLQVYAAGTADVLIGVRHDDVITGGGTTTGADPYLAGEIEEVRIYDRPLGAGEIATLFALGPGAL